MNGQAEGLNWGVREKEELKMNARFGAYATGKRCSSLLSGSRLGATCWWCGRGGNSDFESGRVMLTFPCLFGT